MKKVIEGNPTLTEEHPTVLDRGAYIYYYDTPHPQVEIPLDEFFKRNGDEHHDYAEGWAKVGAALIEARRLGKYPVHHGHPSELVSDVRWYLRNNQEIYDLIHGGEYYVRLRLLNVNKHDLALKDDPRGIKSYSPRARWTVDIITREAMEDFPSRKAQHHNLSFIPQD